MFSFKRRVSCSVLVLATYGTVISSGAQTTAASRRASILKPTAYRHYVESFRQQEREATGKVGDDSWEWMEREIPWFDASDKRFEEMYYFRWYAWQKHLVETKRGYIITEWLPKPEMVDGSFGALPDAAAFHIAEARWLADKKIAEDDARYWMSPDAAPRKYSTWFAWTVLGLTQATGDSSLGRELLPSLEANYGAWEKSNRDANGLFWSIDTRDAMEKSISGDGYRPTLNSYMYGDARAIAEMAAIAGDTGARTEFEQKANALRGLIETNLWNPKDQFYEVLSPALDSGIRREKRFVDPGTVMQLSGVRELIGYVPWMFGIPTADRGVAWKQLFDPQGFDGRFGATTAERRSPRFRFASSDQCTWNGPSWPYATTETLLALAEFEDNSSQTVMTKADYYRLFSRYVDSQHLKLANGEVIDWIDEDLDADTNEWIAKDMLIQKQKQVGRGNYYNHSGFADPLITGFIGLRPRSDSRIVLKPLLPAGEWKYFALDGLPYHGHFLTILWDADGKRYGHGAGFQLMVDGKKVAGRIDLGELNAVL
jgi:hypothetical protein